MGQFQCENTETPHVHLSVILLLPMNKLWGHPAHRAHFGRSAHLFSSQLGRIAKINKFDLALLVEQNIV